MGIVATPPTTSRHDDVRSFFDVDHGRGRPPEEFLSEVEARGLTVVADGGDLRIRPGSRLTPELVERLRARVAQGCYAAFLPGEVKPAG